MKDPIEHLEEALKSSSFNVGEYLNHGFRIWKKGVGSFIGFSLLVIIISLVLAFIPIIGSLLSSLLVGPCLTLGAYYVSQRIDDDEEYSFENFFDGFQSAGEVVVLNLIIFLIALLLMVPFAMLVGFPFVMDAFTGDSSSMDFDDFGPMALLALIPIIYASLLTAFALPILGFYKLSSWESLQYSARFCHKHWILLFIFYVIVIFIILLGLIGLIIGIFITMSFMYPMMYAAFKDVTDWDGYNQEESDPEIDNLDYFR